MRKSSASAELVWQVEKSTPAAYEPTLRSTSVCLSLGLYVHGPVIASCPFRCLSPLFCMALRRLDSRAVEAAVSASLPFSLSTSLSSHSAGLETLFSLEQQFGNNEHRVEKRFKAIDIQPSTLLSRIRCCPSEVVFLYGPGAASA